MVAAAGGMGIGAMDRQRCGQTGLAPDCPVAATRIELLPG
jgi:hypothetical protein